MREKKALTVGKMMLATFSQWSIWYLGIFLLIYIALHVIFINLNGTIEWTILDAHMQSTRVYFLILGLLSMGGYLTEFVSNGVTRRDYFRGVTISLFPHAFIITACVGVLYVLERLLLSLTGWDQWLSGAAASGDEAFLVTLTMVFFQLLIFYLVGWFISAGFYHHWLLGFGFIAASHAIVILHDYVWGRGDNTLPYFHWLPLEQLSAGLVMSVSVSVGLVILMVLFMRILTKNAVVEV